MIHSIYLVDLRLDRELRLKTTDNLQLTFVNQVSATGRLIMGQNG